MECIATVELYYIKMHYGNCHIHLDLINEYDYYQTLPILTIMLCA